MYDNGTGKWFSMPASDLHSFPEICAWCIWPCHWLSVFSCLPIFFALRFTHLSNKAFYVRVLPASLTLPLASSETHVLSGPTTWETPWLLQGKPEALSLVCSQDTVASFNSQATNICWGPSISSALCSHNPLHLHLTSFHRCHSRYHLFTCLEDVVWQQTAVGMFGYNNGTIFSFSTPT